MTCNVFAVRVLIADTGETELNKEALDALISVYGTNTFVVAAAAARAIAAKYAGSVNKRAGDVSVNASDKYKHYNDLARQLDLRAALFGLDGNSVYAGGISQSDKDTREDDSDRVEPFFARDTLQEPGSLNDLTDEWDE